MKSKKIAAALLCAALIFSMFGCSKPKAKDFRNANWGDSRAAVEKSEEGEYVFASDDLILFMGTFGEEQAEIYYSFNEDKLVEAQCKIVINNRILNVLIDSYVSLREALIAEYGEPVDPEYRIFLTTDPDEMVDSDNLLIYRQLLRYETVWHTETSEIVLELNYTDPQINYIMHAKPLPEAQAK